MPLATDASASGGAVCRASMLTEPGHALALDLGASLRAPHAGGVQLVGVQPGTLALTQAMRSLSLPVLGSCLISDLKALPKSNSHQTAVLVLRGRTFTAGFEQQLEKLADSCRERSSTCGSAPAAWEPLGCLCRLGSAIIC